MVLSFEFKRKKEKRDFLKEKEILFVSQGSCARALALAAGSEAGSSLLGSRPRSQQPAASCSPLLRVETPIFVFPREKKERKRERREKRENSEKKESSRSRSVFSEKRECSQRKKGVFSLKR